MQTRGSINIGKFAFNENCKRLYSCREDVCPIFTFTKGKITSWIFSLQSTLTYIILFNPCNTAVKKVVPLHGQSSLVFIGKGRASEQEVT
jgi:hypothetical protein